MFIIGKKGYTYDIGREQETPNQEYPIIVEAEEQEDKSGPIKQGDDLSKVTKVTLSKFLSEYTKKNDFPISQTITNEISTQNENGFPAKITNASVNGQKTQLQNTQQISSNVNQEGLTALENLGFRKGRDAEKKFGGNETLSNNLATTVVNTVYVTDEKSGILRNNRFSSVKKLASEEKNINIPYSVVNNTGFSDELNKIQDINQKGLSVNTNTFHTIGLNLIKNSFSINDLSNPSLPFFSQIDSKVSLENIRPKNLIASLISGDVNEDLNNFFSISDSTYGSYYSPELRFGNIPFGIGTITSASGIKLGIQSFILIYAAMVLKVTLSLADNKQQFIKSQKDFNDYLANSLGTNNNINSTIDNERSNYRTEIITTNSSISSNSLLKNSFDDLVATLLNKEDISFNKNERLDDLNGVPVEELLNKKSALYLKIFNSTETAKNILSLFISQQFQTLLRQSIIDLEYFFKKSSELIKQTTNAPSGVIDTATEIIIMFNKLKIFKLVDYIVMVTVINEKTTMVSQDGKISPDIKNILNIDEELLDILNRENRNDLSSVFDDKREYIYNAKSMPYIYNNILESSLSASIPAQLDLKNTDVTAVKSLYKNFKRAEEGKKPFQIENDEIANLQKRFGKEFVPFFIEDLRTHEFLFFHAFLTQISDGFATNYNTIESMGRLESIKTYSNTERKIQLGFKIFATNRDDLEFMYFKLNKLITMLYPKFTRGREIEIPSETDSNKKDRYLVPFSQIASGTPMVRIRVGDFIKSNYNVNHLNRLFGKKAEQENVITKYFNDSSSGLPGFLDNLDFDVQDSTWELEPGFQVPKIITVGLGFSPVHDIIPGLDHNGLNRAPVYRIGGKDSGGKLSGINHIYDYIDAKDKTIKKVEEAEAKARAEAEAERANKEANEAVDKAFEEIKARKDFSFSGFQQQLKTEIL